MDETSDSQLEATQATQETIDPRRFGEQQSGFSDEDLADIICILIPYSDAAVQVAQRTAELAPEFVIEQDHTSRIRMNYDDTEKPYTVGPTTSSEYHLAFRFSSKLKNALKGFVFGRNAHQCDVTVSHDLKCVSNTHFKIYFNEHCFLMIEDMSSSGTVLSGKLILSGRKPLKGAEDCPKMHILGSGSMIKVLNSHYAKHQAKSEEEKNRADISFLVRIPHRHGRHAEAYAENLRNYLQQTKPDPNKTIVPGPDGRLELFRASPQRPTVRAPVVATRQLSSSILASSGAGTWKGSNKYNFIGKIGQGAFATVFAIADKNHGRPYAAKELEKRRFMKNGVLDQKVENEMKIMQRVSHPNIVQFKEHLDPDKTHLYIIMEFVGGGDLGKYIEANGPLSEPNAQTIARQLVGALAYLHDMNITHRDVKPDNILIQSQSPLVVKLTDFGLSKMIDHEATFLRTFCGTLLYCAPEVYAEFVEYDVFGRRIKHGVKPDRGQRSQRYGHNVDIWSLGGVLYYTLTTQPPYPARNGIGHAEFLHQVMTTVVDLGRLSEALISADCQHFLSETLRKRPELRPTAKKLLNHEWIRASPDSSDVAPSPSPNGGVDELLEAEASQLSLEDRRAATPGANGEKDVTVASDDNLLQQEVTDDENRVGDSAEQDKENHAPRPATQDKYLFGEVGQSALGSQGQVVEKRLNLPATPKSGTTPKPFRSKVEIPDSQANSDDEENTPRQDHSYGQWSQPIPLDLSPDACRSVDVVHNIDLGGNSQSLDGAESIMGQLDMRSRTGFATPSIGADSNRSKRKSSFATNTNPCSSIENEPASKKRRSARRVHDFLNRQRAPIPDENELLAQVPFKSSKSHAPEPQPKSVYWDNNDMSTVHLDYPEMTVAQWNAFREAAEDRKRRDRSAEIFAPNKSPLWALAEKYFPPMSKIQAEQPLLWALAKDSGVATEPVQRKPGAIPEEGGYLRSSGESMMPGISVRLGTSIVTWGTSSKNTECCPNIPNIPECAFKIMVWRAEKFDPSRSLKPWFRYYENNDLYFYIATKATEGLYINGRHLPSNDPSNRESSCKNWMQLYNGDRITVWNESNEDNTLEKIELVFNCTWGGSCCSRESSEYPTPELVSEEWARKLDKVCVKAERKAKEYRPLLEMDELDSAETEERMARIKWEQRLSRNFEKQCREAKKALSLMAKGTGSYSGSHSYCSSSSSDSRQSSQKAYSNIV